MSWWSKRGGAKLELLATLWPSFPHYERFQEDTRLTGIRLNSAMMSNPELDKELLTIEKLNRSRKVDLFFDVKARQPRVTWVDEDNKERLDLRLNHPIKCKTPCVVIFKGGVDHAELDHLEEGGRRLVFNGGPRYKVKPGESLYVRDPSLHIGGDLFIPEEKLKIEKCRKAGFKKWFLSYVEEERDLDQFFELAGKDNEVWLKIESMRGLDFVARHFKKRENLVLVAARGDLYVEIDRPHNIAGALRMIVNADPEACVASRILLSVVDGPVPSCADFLELQWLHDVGYRRMMLCDELCLKGDLLGTAVNAFESFRGTVPA